MFGIKSSQPKVQNLYDTLELPSIADMQVQLEDQVQQGILTPEQAQAILLQRSNMEDVNQDPQTRQAQMDALAQLQNITDSGGMTAVDKASMNDIFTDEDTKSRGAREAILQNAQARGAGGSGAELLAQLMNQQDSATRANSRGLDVNAQAQQRALQALSQQGTLAGQIGSQQFNQDASKAGAMDEIAKFNAQNQQQVNNMNVTNNNAAQGANLAAKQNVSNNNVATHNTQETQNKGLYQQNYNNQLAKINGQTGVNAQNSDIEKYNNQQTADDANKTIGTALTAIGMSDERQKEDIEDFNPSDFLDSLTAHKYNYKDPKYGQGQQAGVMAQDLEKTDLGSNLVVNTPEGKMVDYGKAGPLTMASMANLNARLKKLENGEEE